MIEGTWGFDDQGRLRAGGGWLDVPFRKVDRAGNRRTGAESLFEVCLDRSAGGIAPGPVNVQRVAPAGFQNRPQIFSRLQALLDPTGVDQQRQSPATGVP